MEPEGSGRGQQGRWAEHAPCHGMSVRDALRWGISLLTTSGSPSPRLDAEVLLAATLEIERSSLYVRWDVCLDERTSERYAQRIYRRQAHEPVAYLVGKRAFYDVDLDVDRHVLIPRPESEHLVEEALQWARSQPNPSLRVLDVGTGSGALAVVLARHLPQARVWAVDLSMDALQTAKRNVIRHGLKDRVLLVQADLTGPFAESFELVVANLPYVASCEMDTLAPDIRLHEPHLALDGGEDGLDVIRRLLSQASAILAHPGLLLLEIDHRQAQTVKGQAEALWPQATVKVILDYAGLERVVRVEQAAKRQAEDQES